MAKINTTTARRKKDLPAKAGTKTLKPITVTPGEIPLRVFIDGNMLAVPLIHDLTSVGLKLGSDAQGNWWLTRKEVRHG